MDKKWNKIMLATRIILSIAVVVLASLEMFGVLERAIDYAVPLLGVYLLILSMQEWKQKRRDAIISICLAVFIFVSTIIVWSGR